MLVMTDLNMELLKKDIKSLGILSIEASGELTPLYVKDAVSAVKQINLNFKDLAAKAKENSKNPTK